MCHLDIKSCAIRSNLNTNVSACGFGMSQRRARDLLILPRHKAKLSPARVFIDYMDAITGFCDPPTDFWPNGHAVAAPSRADQAAAQPRVRLITGGLPASALNSEPQNWPDAFHGWNEVASFGAYISGAGLLIFFICMAEAFVRRRVAGNNPWGSGRRPTSAHQGVSSLMSFGPNYLCSSSWLQKRL